VRQRVRRVEGTDASFKYEDVYLRCYDSVPDLERGLGAYFTFYNHERLHQSLGYRTPAEVYGGTGERAGEE
jgi:putative transposase